MLVITVDAIFIVIGRKSGVGGGLSQENRMALKDTVVVKLVSSLRSLKVTEPSVPLWNRYSPSGSHALFNGFWSPVTVVKPFACCIE